MGDKRAESKVTLVYGQMNEPPGARARVALTGECMHTLALFQDSAETYAVSRLSLRVLTKSGILTQA